MTMNTAFVTNERDRDQNEHHDENNALFIFGKIENSEQMLHLFA